MGVIALLTGVSLGAYLVRQSVINDRHTHIKDRVKAVIGTETPLSHTAPNAEGEIAVPPPPFSEDIFPCSDCHDPEDDLERERRKLTLEHEGIVLQHDEKNRWCLDCHDGVERDFLHLADGTLVDFKESYKLCGQCHGPTFRDWKMGVHGKRSGKWNGQKTYLLCVHCHDPHSPSFKPIHPFPAPLPPQAITTESLIKQEEIFFE
jgi:hypothetical protein